MSLNFRDIAKKKLEEVERPPLPPVGTYLWLVTKLPVIETSADEKWDYVIFPVKIVAPTEDVDSDAINAYGDITKYQTTHRFIFDKNDPAKFAQTEFNLRRFLEEHLKCADPSMSMTEAMNAAVNNQFLAPIVWRADKNDAELMHANIGRTAPTE